jgi:hypothetical protein
MWGRVALVTADIWEERSASIIRVKQGTTSALAALKHAANIRSSLILGSLMMEAIRSSVTLRLTRVTWRNTPQDGTLHKLVWLSILVEVQQSWIVWRGEGGEIRSVSLHAKDTASADIPDAVLPTDHLAMQPGAIREVHWSSIIQLLALSNDISPMPSPPAHA